MVCPYCDTDFEMEALASYDEVLGSEQADDLSWETKAGSEWNESETNGLMEYVCKSCGGVIVGEETTGATSCPYCGNPVVVMRQFSVGMNRGMHENMIDDQNRVFFCSIKIQSTNL